MAKFTASVALDFAWQGNAIKGAAGTVFRIPDALKDEFDAQVAPSIPGGVTWTVEDEGPLTDSLRAIDYGVTADGTTDDTTALQAAVAALAASKLSTLVLPVGTIVLSAAITLPAMSSKRIIGQGRNVTVLKQSADDVAIIQTSVTDTHTITLAGMSLVYSTAQDSSNTGAAALLFTGPTGSSWYYWRVSDLFIKNAAYCVAIDQSATGSLAVWNCSFDSIVSTNISCGLIRFVSPTVVGMPVNTFHQITHLGSATAPTEPAIHLSACGAVFVGLDIEDWSGQLVYVIGGVPLTIHGFHVERQTTDGDKLIEIANGPFVLDGFKASLEVTDNTAYLFAADIGARLDIGPCYIKATVDTGATLGLLNAAAGSFVRIAALVDENDNVDAGLGLDLPRVGPADPMLATTTAAVAASDTAYLYAFTVPRPVRVTKARVDVGTASGNADAGIYDSGGTLLSSSGSTSIGATGALELDLADSVLLQPGTLYYAALAADNTTAKFTAVSTATNHIAASAATPIAAKVASSFPLPSSITVAGVPDRTFPILFEP